jgi:hypothetical protein
MMSIMPRLIVLAAERIRAHPISFSTRELVKPANDLGFFWGGHFSDVSDKDGIHFEFAKF